MTIINVLVNGIIVSGKVEQELPILPIIKLESIEDYFNDNLMSLKGFFIFLIKSFDPLDLENTPVKYFRGLDTLINLPEDEVEKPEYLEFLKSYVENISDYLNQFNRYDYALKLLENKKLKFLVIFLISLFPLTPSFEKILQTPDLLSLYRSMFIRELYWDKIMGGSMEDCIDKSYIKKNKEELIKKHIKIAKEDEVDECHPELFTPKLYFELFDEYYVGYNMLDGAENLLFYRPKEEIYLPTFLKYNYIMFLHYMNFIFNITPILKDDAYQIFCNTVNLQYGESIDFANYQK